MIKYLKKELILLLESSSMLQHLNYNLIHLIILNIWSVGNNVFNILKIERRKVQTIKLFNLKIRQVSWYTFYYWQVIRNRQIKNDFIIERVSLTIWFSS